MLKFLIIPLADNAVSYCHYDSSDSPKRLSVDLLKVAIVWAMKENVSVQFIYPSTEVSEEIKLLIDEVDHTDIVPYDVDDIGLREIAEVVVFDNWEAFTSFEFKSGQSYVIRTSISDLFQLEEALKESLVKVDRVNVVITDIEGIDEDCLKNYDLFLHGLIPLIINEYKLGHQVQLNILTDRMMLKDMNNCNAGYETVMLAPDGKFYACPAFYLNGLGNIGDLQNGLDIRNPQLYRISHAPICRNCDAYQCKRCIWLNQKMTGEINTPSREQCMLANIERNASRDLLKDFRKINPEFMADINIPAIDYLDPFEKIVNKTY